MQTLSFRCSQVFLSNKSANQHELSLSFSISWSVHLLSVYSDLEPVEQKTVCEEDVDFFHELKTRKILYVPDDGQHKPVTYLREIHPVGGLILRLLSYNGARSFTCSLLSKCMKRLSHTVRIRAT